MLSVSLNKTFPSFFRITTNGSKEMFYLTIPHRGALAGTRNSTMVTTNGINKIMYKQFIKEQSIVSKVDLQFPIQHISETFKDNC